MGANYSLSSLYSELGIYFSQEQITNINSRTIARTGGQNKIEIRGYDIVKNFKADQMMNLYNLVLTDEIIKASLNTQFFTEMIDKLQTKHTQEAGILGFNIDISELYSKLKEKLDIKQLVNVIYETIGQIDAINSISFIGTGAVGSTLDLISINQVNTQYNKLIAKKIVDLAQSAGIEIKKTAEEYSESHQKAGITTDMILIGGLIALGVLVLIRR
jgi:hypothetical protein